MDIIDLEKYLLAYQPVRRWFRLQQIRINWWKFELKPFPTIRENDDDDERVFLDMLAAGCISTFIKQGGVLNADKVAMLDSFYHDITSRLANLEGEWLEHFTLLQLLCKSVLDEVGTRSTS